MVTACATDIVRAKLFQELQYFAELTRLTRRYLTVTGAQSSGRRTALLANQLDKGELDHLEIPHSSLLEIPYGWMKIATVMFHIANIIVLCEVLQ